MKAIIPISPEQLDGQTIAVEDDRFNFLSARDCGVIVSFHDLPPSVSWFQKLEFMYCQRQDDPETVKVIRMATDEEIKLFRVPVWIQSDEVPECCGRPMIFVGQLDDDRLCAERPDDAKYWWHDAASFYVFTCSQCLECKAVGQQF